MQVTRFIALVLIGAALFACNTNQPKDTPKTDTKADTAKFDPKKVGEKALAKMNEPYNRESAFRYVDTAPETNLWKALLRKSKYGKEVELGSYTLLVPTNEVLRAWDPEKMKKVRNLENLDALNKLVGDHILKTPITVEKMGDITEVETITGKKHKVQAGAQNIGGGIYMLNQIFTPKGSVVLMSKIIE
ncbi:MAG: fasciclin domain-containing protein [Flavobacteriales bacterium]